MILFKPQIPPLRFTLSPGTLLPWAIPFLPWPFHALHRISAVLFTDSSRQRLGMNESWCCTKQVELIVTNVFSFPRAVCCLGWLGISLRKLLNWTFHMEVFKLEQNQLHKASADATWNTSWIIGVWAGDFWLCPSLEWEGKSRKSCKKENSIWALLIGSTDMKPFQNTSCKTLKHWADTDEKSETTTAGMHSGV